MNEMNEIYLTIVHALIQVLLQVFD
jgi:hypothetical protein